MAKARVQAYREAPPGATVFKAFSKLQALCQGCMSQEHKVPADAWICLGIDWCADSAQRAQDNWRDIKISILLDGEPIEDPKQYSTGPYPIKLECPDRVYDGYAMGLALYVPPLPVGVHQVTWEKQIERDISDGWYSYPQGKQVTLSSTLHVVAEAN